ncbi:MAG: ATP phosphoribosyltransferase regulatory subunit [Lachnospiraceae bacterium]|nr:ATP phosphoribosyltransferase regulatory subunit [Lachnospiraceae bacterium]
MIQLLHTPEGVRDIYGEESRVKELLRASITDCLHRYGFQDIQTPSFEFFDIFNKERGTVPSKDMYKFFDRDGNTLVLRPDMTPSIARCAAKYFRDETRPLRLCYCGNTYINNNSYQGRLKETTQIGAELFADASVLADADLIALTADCLQAAGLTEFQIEIGNADFFKGLVEETNLTLEEQEELRVLIKNKNIFGVHDLLSKTAVPEELRELFAKLPELFGSIETLRAVKSQTRNPRALQALERLERLDSLLHAYGCENYVSFDLGMLSKYNYYTGIIFRAITYGTGEAVASGGRYNRLAGQFGFDAPAIGMSITLDYLMIALERQNRLPEAEAPVTYVAYTPETMEEAAQKAAELRKNGVSAALFERTQTGRNE